MPGDGDTELKGAPKEENGTVDKGYSGKNASTKDVSGVNGGDGDASDIKRDSTKHHALKTTTPDKNEGLLTATSPSRDVKFSLSTSALSYETAPTSLISMGGSSHNTKTALAVTLPPAVAIFLLAVASFILLVWKKKKSKSSKRDSLKSGRDETREELGEFSGRLHDTFSTKYPGSSLKGCADLDCHVNRQQGALVTRNNNCTKFQYEEVNEIVYPVPKGSFPQNKDIYDPTVYYKGGNRYEEIDALGRQSNHGYGEVIVHGGHRHNQLGYDEEKHKETREEGSKTTNVTGHINYTLNTDSPSASSYTSMPVNKQDDGYDTLDRLQSGSHAKSKTTSDYDVTERLGKGDVKVGQIDSGNYSTISTIHTDAYDKLDRARRCHKAEDTCPNTYNILEPRALSEST